MKTCNELGSYQGSCCCNCKYQIEVMKHPWNKGGARGRITEQLGWVCSNPLDVEDGRVIFFDREHSMCELHTPKDDEEKQ